MKGNRYFLNFSPQSGLAEHMLFIFVLDKLFLKFSYTLSLQDHITIFVLWCFLPTGFDCYFKLILLIFKCRETNEAPPSVSQCTKCVCYLGPHLFTNYSAYSQSTEMMRLIWAPLTPFSPLLMLVAPEWSGFPLCHNQLTFWTSNPRGQQKLQSSACSVTTDVSDFCILILKIVIPFVLGASIKLAFQLSSSMGFWEF